MTQRGGASELIDAVRDGNIGLVQTLVRNNPELIHQKSSGGHTPIDAIFLDKGQKGIFGFSTGATCATDLTFAEQMQLYVILKKAGSILTPRTLTTCINIKDDIWHTFNNRFSEYDFFAIVDSLINAEDKPESVNVLLKLEQLTKGDYSIIIETLGLSMYLPNISAKIAKYNNAYSTQSKKYPGQSVKSKEEAIAAMRAELFPNSAAAAGGYRKLRSRKSRKSRRKSRKTRRH